MNNLFKLSIIRVTPDINLEKQLRKQLKELTEGIYKRTDKYSAKEIEDNITEAVSEVQETLRKRII